MRILHVTILFAFSVAACGDSYPSLVVDAGPVPDDAAIHRDASAPDAAPPLQQRGCSNMGNLPLAMTAVLTDDDPVPSALLVELQEQHVGDKHPVRSWVIPAGAFCLTSGTGVLANGIWTLTSTNTTLEAPFPLPHGTTFTAQEFYYIRQSVSVSTYTMRLKESVLKVGQPLVVNTPMTVAQNNGVNYPSIDSAAANAGSGHGLPYTVPSDLNPPFNEIALRLEFKVFQNAVPFDAQFLGVAVFVQKL